MNKMSKRRIHIETDKLIMNRIEEARLTRKMTQSALAKALDISSQQMQKYVKCSNSLSIGRLVQIARKLNVDIGYFLQDLSFAQCEPSIELDITIPYLSIKNRRVKAAIHDLIVSLAGKDKTTGEITDAVN